MKKYSEYKDTGHTWLGLIPESWDLIKLKHNTDISFSSVDRHEYDEEIKVSICHYPNAYKNEVIDSDTNLSKGTCTESEFEKYQLHKGQVIITKDSESADDIGVPTYVNETLENGVCGYHLAMLTPYENSLLGKYLFRYIQTKNVSSFFETNSNGVTRFGLGKPTIANLYVPIPPLKEQTQIARYLDYQTGLIDQIIEKKELLIKKLKEQRQAIINEAVTKGLNPNTKIKDSGIEWLGEIPEHWEVVNLKYLGSFQNGVSKGGEYFGSGYPFVNYGDVYNNEVLPKLASGLAKSSEDDRNRFSIEKGDVIFTRTSETIEEIGIASTCFSTIENSIFSGFLIRFRQHDNRMLDTLSQFYFRSFIPRTFFVKEMNLVTRASLSQELLKRLPVLLPPFKEQIDISNYLKNKTESIDLISKKTINSIEKLKNYRQSIISEAVTGKIDVRDWVESIKV